MPLDFLMCKISIALCTYNGARYLQQQLDSFSAQSRQPDELIVCDDLSTDTSLQLAREFQHRVLFPVKIYRNDVRLGSTQNFARAITLCSGDLIALSDQDDVWHCQKLAKTEEVFESDARLQAVFGDLDIVDEELQPLGYSMWDRIGFTDRHRKMLAEGHSYKVLLKRSIVTGAAMAFRASLRDRFLPIPEGWTHDYWIALIAAATGEIATIGEPVVLYRQHGSNQIGGMKESLQNQVERSVNAGCDTYRHAAAAYLDLVSRLRAQGLANDSRIRLLNGKIAHLRVRANLPEKRLYRLPRIMLEFVRLRYFRFANGWKSAARDLLS